MRFILLGASLFLGLLFSNFAEARSYGIYPAIDSFSTPVTVDNVCVSKDHTKLETLKPVRVCTSSSMLRLACRQGEAEICRPLKSKENPRGAEYLKNYERCTQFVLKKLPPVSRLSRWVTTCGPRDAQDSNMELVGNGEGQYLRCKKFVRWLDVWPINYQYTLVQNSQGDQAEGTPPNAIFSLPDCP